MVEYYNIMHLNILIIQPVFGKLLPGIKNNDISCINFGFSIIFIKFFSVTKYHFVIIGFPGTNKPNGQSCNTPIK